MQTRNYSDFTARYGSLVGIDYATMTAQEQAFASTYLQNAIEQMWTASPWIDVCPYGEARFVGNVLNYPNDLTQTAYWTATALTPATAPTIANPCDGRFTTTQLLETAANSAHKEAQSYSFIPNVTYQFSAYIRANGRSYAYLSVNDGSVTHTAYFNVSAGTIGTYANNSQAPTIQQCANGFWLVTLYFTSDAAAGNGSAAVQLSPDGSTLSYAGNTALGIYAWGVVLQQTSFASPSQLIIPFNQLGEANIEDFFDAWRDYPNSTNYPRPQGYTITPQGIIIVGSAGWTNNYWGYTPPQSFLFGNPVYIYYRQQCPSYQGAAFSQSTVYTYGQQMLFTAADGTVNYWQYTSQTPSTPNQSPDNTPGNWTILAIPEVFFKYVCYAALADYLRMDGQFDKAEAANAQAESFLASEFDKQERQMGWVQPRFKVQTHVTSQPRFI